MEKIEQLVSYFPEREEIIGCCKHLGDNKIQEEETMVNVFANS